MLAVGVQAPAKLVAMFDRVPVALGDPESQPPVLGKGDHESAGLHGHSRRLVSRAVVDDEQVDAGQVLPRFLEHAGK